MNRIVRQRIRDLPLKELGESLLVFEIMERVTKLDLDVPLFEDAIRLASLLHRNQYRSNRGGLPKDTYITHPLRNTLRLLRYGVTDQDILLACILHDTVEDCARGYAEMFSPDGVSTLTNAQCRVIAFNAVETMFGSEVARIVRAVTLPPRKKGESQEPADKRARYFRIVCEEIKDAQACVVKHSDLVDNAVGLFHNTGMSPEAQYYLALKYNPLLPVLRYRIQQPDVAAILGEEGLAKALAHLDRGVTELRAILKEGLRDGV